MAKSGLELNGRSLLVSEYNKLSPAQRRDAMAETMGYTKPGMTPEERAAALEKAAAELAQSVAPQLREANLHGQIRSDALDGVKLIDLENYPAPHTKRRWTALAAKHGVERDAILEEVSPVTAKIDQFHADAKDLRAQDRKQKRQEKIVRFLSAIGIR